MGARWSPAAGRRDPLDIPHAASRSPIHQLGWRRSIRNFATHFLPSILTRGGSRRPLGDLAMAELPLGFSDCTPSLQAQQDFEIAEFRPRITVFCGALLAFGYRCCRSLAVFPSRLAAALETLCSARPRRCSSMHPAAGVPACFAAAHCRCLARGALSRLGTTSRRSRWIAAWITV